jgi:hypothetical protein
MRTGTSYAARRCSGRADVVVVGVGDQYGRHVARSQAERGDGAQHGVAVAGVAGVDEGAAVPVLEGLRAWFIRSLSLYGACFSTKQ